MSDDQGWGDTGYNGHPVLRTPHLDAMASAGLRFERFYSAAPVCSPTRGSALTGRHPFRYGITWALGHGNSKEETLREREVTIAEALRPHGFATGHFGKWHLGTKPKEGSEEPTPDQHGFEEWFSTKYAVPTWDPADCAGRVNRRNCEYYHNGELVRQSISGDDSRVMMDRVIPFIEKAVQAKRRFLAVVWFHAPHEPVFAGGKYLDMYRGQPGRLPHYYGCLTAMDEQIGRLRATLRRLRAADDTLFWFCSDNGPEGDAQSETNPGSAGPFRGRKRSLFEGGIRVPAILEWPSRIRKGQRTNFMACTSDFYPTVLDALGILPPADQPRPIDGISLMPVIERRAQVRPVAIAFETQGDRRSTRGSPRLAWIETRYKLLSDLDASGEEMLFDLERDPGETRNLIHTLPERAAQMREQLARWRASCRDSEAGRDYF